MDQGGNKVDELGGEEPSFVGHVSGKSATVAFRSAFEGTGKASLTLHGKQLQWQVLQHEGESWLPESATLHRVRNSRWGGQLKCELAR